MRRPRFRLFLIVAIGVAGCRAVPTPLAGTGARETAQRFFAALIRQDCDGAYAALHPDERPKVSREQFTQLAKTFYKHLGFEPGTVQVWASDERADGATAHVTVIGRSPQSHKQYKDAVALRRTRDGWGVILSPKFGRPPRH